MGSFEIPTQEAAKNKKITDYFEPISSKKTQKVSSETKDKYDYKPMKQALVD